MQRLFIIQKLERGVAIINERRRLKGDYGHGADLLNAVDLLRPMTESDEEFRAYQDLLWIQTRDLIEWYWPYVVRFSEALLEHKTLDRKAIHAIMAELKAA